MLEKFHLINSTKCTFHLTLVHTAGWRLRLVHVQKLAALLLPLFSKATEMTSWTVKITSHVGDVENLSISH